MTGMAHLGETGVDEQSAMILGYDQGQLAVLFSAVRTPTPEEATLMGEGGRIRVHPPIYCPSRITLSRPGQADEVIEAPTKVMATTTRPWRSNAAAGRLAGKRNHAPG